MATSRNHNLSCRDLNFYSGINSLLGGWGVGIGPVNATHISKLIMLTVARKAITLKTLLIHFDFANRIAIDYFCPLSFYVRYERYECLACFSVAGKRVAEAETCLSVLIAHVFLTPCSLTLQTSSPRLRSAWRTTSATGVSWPVRRTTSERCAKQMLSSPRPSTSSLAWPCKSANEGRFLSY